MIVQSSCSQAPWWQFSHRPTLSIIHFLHHNDSGQNYISCSQNTWSGISTTIGKKIIYFQVDLGTGIWVLIIFKLFLLKSLSFSWFLSFTFPGLPSSHQHRRYWLRGCVVLSFWLGLNHNIKGGKETGVTVSVTIKISCGGAELICFNAHVQAYNHWPHLFVPFIRKPICLTVKHVPLFLSHSDKKKHFHITPFFFLPCIWHLNSNSILTYQSLQEKEIIIGREGGKYIS